MSSSVPIDSAGQVREGESLDLDALRGFLRATLPEIDADRLVVEQFPRGHSNLTYLVRAGEREMVLRRPPFGSKVQTAHDMSREYRVLKALEGAYELAPRALAYCDDASVLGAPFYLMQRVRGIILRGARVPSSLALDAGKLRALSTALVDNLVKLHAVDVQSSGLAATGRREGYVERQVRGWTDRYHKAQTDDVADMDRVAEWLDKSRPAESGFVLVHNDYRYDNLVLDPLDATRIIAVLDWEMATVGDPWMDVGTSLGYWIDPDDSDEVKMIALGPTVVEGGLRRRDVVERYAEGSGRPAGDALFYYVFGLFKIGVIAQQIYKRFKEGHTKDPRFAMMIVAVRLLAQQATRAMDRGRLHGLG